MKVIICGAGQVGGQICRYLPQGDFDVTAIDLNAELVRRLTDSMDVNGIAGSAADPEVLQTAGAKEADLIVAATSSDELNVVCCLVARSLESEARTIARLRNPSYHGVFAKGRGGPVDIAINPEEEVARAVLALLDAPSVFERRSVLEGKGLLIGIKLEAQCPVLNTPLDQLSQLYPTLKTVVVGLRRGGAFSIPSPKDQLFANDEVYLMAASEELERTLTIFKKESQPCSRVLIVGAGNVGKTIAARFEREKRRTVSKIIELDRNRAERAAGELRRTVVFHGDGLDINLLEEAGIRSADAIVAVTDDEKSNLLVTTRAKRAKDSLFALSLVNQPSLMALMEPLGIDSIVNPRALTVTSILPYVRGLRDGSISSVGDAEAEVVEVRITASTPLSGKAIRNAGLPEGALVGAVEKNGEIVKVTPDTRLDAGCKAAFFAETEVVPELMELVSSDVSQV